MKSLLCLVSVFVAMLALPSAAPAALGGDAASVQADQSRLNAIVQTTPANDFTQFVLQLPSGTTVREYVSLAGPVFAVTWEGPSLPDLRQLLGSYFQQYLEAIQGGGTGARVIRQPGLVVYTGGHMRAFRGLAYVPQLQPQGVVSEHLQ